MKSLLPLWQVWTPLVARGVRLYLSTLHPLAPSAMHLRGARWLAALEAPQ